MLAPIRLVTSLELWLMVCIHDVYCARFAFANPTLRLLCFFCWLLLLFCTTPRYDIDSLRLKCAPCPIIYYLKDAWRRTLFARTICTCFRLLCLCKTTRFIYGLCAWQLRKDGYYMPVWCGWKATSSHFGKWLMNIYWRLFCLFARLRT